MLSHRLQIKNDAACGEKGFCCLGFPLKEGIVADSSMNAYASEEAAEKAMAERGFKPLH